MNMNRRPEPGDKIIDSRDVIAAIDELEGDRGELSDAVDEATGQLADYHDEARSKKEDVLDELSEAVALAEDALREWDNEYGDELSNLKALAEEASGCGDWQYGAQLIKDDQFEGYAEELAHDVCDMRNGDKWPFTCIDWKAAAEELQQDYTSVTFGDHEYWIRS